MGKNILIAGGSGLTGNQIRKAFEKKGHTVAVLTREPNSKLYKTFYWNLDMKEIDEEAIPFADIIINLSGENISEGRWTLKRKEKIINSRVLTTNFLFDKINESKSKPDKYISASAIGYYGTFTSETIFTEDMPSGEDFLAVTCKLWEDSVKNIELLNIPTVILRMGVVLAREGGAFPKIMKTVKKGVASPIGSGKQYMPWIHIEDLAEMFVYFSENSPLTGTFNAVSNQSITNSEFMKTAAIASGKKYFMPRVPSFLLRTIYGEMSSILLEGSRVSAKKIEEAGFKYKYKDFSEALKDLIK